MREMMKVEDKEYDSLIWPIKAACRIFGSWPPDDPNSTAAKIHRNFVIGLMIFGCFSTTSESLVFWGIDMNETIECSLVTSAFYLALVRVTVLASRQTDIRFVVDMMRRDWVTANPEERELLRERCGLAFRLSKIFIISIILAYSDFNFLPMLEAKLHPEAAKKLPFGGYFYFNHTDSPRYELAYLMSSSFGTFGCSTIAGVTTFSLITTIHAAAKFSLVQREFKKIGWSEWSNTSPEIGRVIRKHQECIRFAEKVEDIINIIALAQFIISTGLLCFAGFQLTTMLEDRTRLAKYSSFLQSAIMELFIFSYSGQMLMTESQEVAEFAYTSNWIGTISPTNMKLVSMRSRKPCTITAGKFYDLSLESFLKVLSSSFSYFTVLLAMKEE